MLFPFLGLWGCLLQPLSLVLRVKPWYDYRLGWMEVERGRGLRVHFLIVAVANERKEGPARTTTHTLPQLRLQINEIPLEV